MSRRDSLPKALLLLKRNLKRKVDKGVLQADESAAIRGRITTCLSLAELAQNVDMTIEAVIENLDLKKEGL